MESSESNPHEENHESRAAHRRRRGSRRDGSARERGLQLGRGRERSDLQRAVAGERPERQRWVSMQIQSLQLTQDASRSEAVTGIRQAASGYCPEYLSVVPAR